MDETTTSVARVNCPRFLGEAKGITSFWFQSLEVNPVGVAYGGDLFTRVFGQYVCCEVFLVSWIHCGD